MFKSLLAFAFSLSCVLTFSQTDTVTIMSYNLLNFPDGRNDCGASNTNLPNRFDTLRKIIQYSAPDIFVACEIQNQKGADSVLNRSLNVFGNTSYTAANFHANNSGLSLQNMLYYNADKLILQYQDRIITSSRDIDHYVLYADDPNLGNFFDTTFFEVYMCHLKAGSSSANQIQRDGQVQLLRDFIDARPEGRNHFVCGDLNVYTSNEDAYQTLISGGSNPLNDPINTPGSWNNSVTYADVHTQSTRVTGQVYDCGSTGGSDDRFDQILVSSNVLSGAENIKYINGSYDALGNDGNHYNSSLISSPTNSQYPDSVVKALFYMSDHLPVVLKTLVTYPTSNGLALNPSQSIASCFGFNDGTATVEVNAGQGPYTFLWDITTGNQTTQTATNLIAGNYCVTVTDNLGETDQVCISVGQPTEIQIGLFQTPESVSCNGQVSSIVSGGTGSYTYSWNDPLNQTTSLATGLCAGDYILTVTDSDGCQSSQQSTVGDNTVGIIENLEEKIILSPNPFSESVQLSVPLPITDYSVQVLNSLGQDVSSIISTNNKDGVVQFNTNNLKPGVYYFVIFSESIIARKQMIKL